MIDCVSPQAGVVMEKRDSYGPTPTAQVEESKTAAGITFFTILLFLTAAAH